MSVLAGAPALASDVNDAIGVALSDTQNTSGTTTSTTFTATLTGGTACGFSFVAPSSGKVLVHNAVNMFNSGASHCVASFRIRTGGTVGSGSDVIAVADSIGLTAAGAAGPADRHGVTQLVTGLTGGTTYNIQQLVHVDGGTGTFNNKHLILVPTL